jgi:hypothetical protein
MKLKEDGRLVLADVIPHEVSPITDARALLSFAWKGGFLTRAVAGLARTAVSDYAKLRNELGLSQYDEAEMIEILAAEGFSAERRRPEHRPQPRPHDLHGGSRLTDRRPGGGGREGPELVGGEAPEQHDAGRQDLRRQIGRVEPARERVHKTPGQQKSDPSHHCEAPGGLPVRTVTAVGEPAVQVVGDEPARHIADERGPDRIEPCPLDQTDEGAVMHHRRHDTDPEEGGELTPESQG